MVLVIKKEFFFFTSNLLTLCTNLNSIYYTHVLYHLGTQEKFLPHTWDSRSAINHPWKQQQLTKHYVEMCLWQATSISSVFTIFEYIPAFDKRYTLFSSGKSIFSAHNGNRNACIATGCPPATLSRISSLPPFYELLHANMNGMGYGT